MDPLIKHYQVDVKYPDVSGAEHLQMLQIRDELAEKEPSLSREERAALAAADKNLVEQAAAFHQELKRFIDLAQYRQENHIAPNRWWWFLDVLAELPSGAAVSSIAQSVR